MADAPTLTPEELTLADAYAHRLGDGSAEARLILDHLRAESYTGTVAPIAPTLASPVDPFRMAMVWGARELVARIEAKIRQSLTATRRPAPPLQFATTDPPEENV